MRVGRGLGFALTLTLAAGISPLPAAPARAASPPELAAIDPISALLERERSWENRNRGDLARENLEKLFRISPEEPRGLAALAALEIKENRIEEARAVIDRLQRAAPDHPALAPLQTLFRLATSDKDKLRQARLLARTRQTESALAAFRALYPAGPPNGELALEYWQLVAESKNGWSAAHVGLQALSRENPDNLDYRLALAQHEVSRAPVSKSALTVLAELAQTADYPRTREAKSSWRNGLRRLGQNLSALPYLRPYLAHDPADTVMVELRESILKADAAHRQLLANPYYQAKKAGLKALAEGRLEEAEERLAYSLQGRPKDFEAVGGMGFLRLRQGNHGEAENYFHQAGKLNPEQKKMWHSLVRTARQWGLAHEARLARAEGEFARAAAKAREALAYDPKEESIALLLAQILAESGQTGEAERGFRQLLAFKPTNREALLGLIELSASSQGRDAAENLIGRLSPGQRQALGASLPTIQAEMRRREAEQLLAAGREEEAGVALRQALAFEPANRPALLALIALNRRTLPPAATQALLAGLSPGQRILLGEALPALQASLLRAEAERLLAAGREEEALAALRQAWGFDPNDPWLCLDLARLHARRGTPAEGQYLFDALLARRPGDGAALYAQALFQSGENSSYGALINLERIAVEERTPAMTRMQRRLWLDYQLQRVREMENKEEARQLLGALEPLVANDLELLSPVAFAWAAQGQVEQGLQLLARIKKESTTLPAAWHLRYARLLAESKEFAELEEELATIAAFAQLTPAETESLAGLQLTAGLAAAARLREGQQPAEAETIYRRLLTLAPANREARLGLLTCLSQEEKIAEALALAATWLAPEAESGLETTLSLVGFLLDHREYSWAGREIESLLFLEPDNRRVLEYAAELARQEGRRDEASAYLQEALAAELRQRRAEGSARPLTRLRRLLLPETGESAIGATPAPSPAGVVYQESDHYRFKKLAEELDRRTPWLSAAWDWRSRAGSGGISQLDSHETTLEWRTPGRQERQFFLRADQVLIQAGELRASSAYARDRFGSLLLAPPGYPASLPEQRASGLALTAGYEREQLRVDLGTTPLGFPVWHLTGGIRRKGDLGPLSYTLDASRRPVTGSLLSFAGTQDPRSGTTWGGVVATGLRLGLSRDQGESLGFWSSLGYHLLNGEHLQENARTQLMGGGYRRIVNQENQVLMIGLAGSWSHFNHNGGEYTLGHGGYYSPLSALSLSLPITFSQRFTRFSYVVRGAISLSRSETASADYYPLDPALQLQANHPVYGETAGTGVGYSLNTAWEYQMNRSLFLGGRFDFERSDYYEPNRLLLYLRYAYEESAANPVMLSPEALTPTSQW